jgi:F-type H+-transporting ATPase subunit delta
MSLRTSATRYAKALLDVAVAEGLDAAVIERDLASVVDAMNRHPDLRRAFTNPGIPQNVRMNVANAFVTRAGIQGRLAKLLNMLGERGRLDLLPVMLDVYRERLLAHRNIVRATVTSASPLSADKVHQLETSLGGLTGKKVQIETTVDPTIIGGVVTRIGSTVYDGSIRTQLQKMRQQLVEKAP